MVPVEPASAPVAMARSPASAEPTLDSTANTTTTTETDAAPAAADAAHNGAPAMTKSALKRQRRQEAWQSQKLARRAAEKDKKRQRKLEIRQRVEAGEMEKPPNQKKLKRREATRDKELHPARVCIDLGFDHLMSDKEIKSMAAQLAYCYSANRLSPRPFPLLITSFTGRLREAYKNRQDWKSWKGVEWWEEGIEQLYQGVPETEAVVVEDQQKVSNAAAATASVEADETMATNFTASSFEAVEPIASTSAAAAIPAAPTSTSGAAPPPISLGSLSGQPRSRAPRSTVVYLTGDSPNILTSLEPGHTYILGGIVDRNRYKRLCLDKAELELGGIRHAQLPIGEALPELKTRKVLTVNQVVEILVKWVEQQEQQKRAAANGGGTGDAEEEAAVESLQEGKEAWEAALRSVMPTRKFDQDGKKKRREARKAAGTGGTSGRASDDDDGGSSDDDDDDDDDGADDSVYVARDEDEEEERGEEEDVSVDRPSGVEGAEASGTAAPTDLAAVVPTESVAAVASTEL